MLQNVMDTINLYLIITKCISTNVKCGYKCLKIYIFYHIQDSLHRKKVEHLYLEEKGDIKIEEENSHFSAFSCENSIDF